VNRWVLAFVCAVVGCGPAGASAKRGPAQAEATVRAALAQWPADFAAKRTAAVCGLFAPDVVLSYPATVDRDFDTICAHFGALFATDDRTFSYAAPVIEDVVADNDTVVVRLIWTLTVLDASGTALEIVQEQGIDVFRRQPDGSWKIRISHAYPL